MPHPNPPDDVLRDLLREAKTIAMVGASSNPEKPSFVVMQKLQEHGYRVIPVNPREQEVLGERAYASLQDIAEPVDVVDVFRRPEDVPPIADAAIAIGAKALWLQSHITNDDAAAKARDAGLIVVQDRCIKAALTALGI